MKDLSLIGPLKSSSPLSISIYLKLENRVRRKNIAGPADQYDAQIS